MGASPALKFQSKGIIFMALSQAQLSKLQGFVPVTVRLDNEGIDVDGTLQPLSPGMAATVEIKTGKRRILEYLFSPIAEISSEAMHGKRDFRCALTAQDR
ncbi:hypothetical protein [Rhizobium sp. P28RR-XV]|uniref:hypothetical protein n=1 Tax=Rhizobium sp. P28RR-XV TaxID=2726737 RepID=UPI0014570AA5|nr:hypothetical protein [Rhizobium sp. P28RR-XV]NLR89468.1 hypothetical protein [Rhizobium sp. P28RR-XV]